MRSNSQILKTIKEVNIIAMFTTILFVQEQMLAMIPNVQATVLLLYVFSRTLGTRRTLLIIIIHTILDTLLYGGLVSFYTPFMFIGWALIPILINTIFRFINNEYYLGLIAILNSLLYSWLFMIPNILIFGKYTFMAYLIADIPFEIIMAASSFLSIVWLYKPLVKVMRKGLLGELRSNDYEN